jgi:integrase
MQNSKTLHIFAGVPELGLNGRAARYPLRYGGGLKILWRRPSWVRVPPPAPLRALSGYVEYLSSRIRQTTIPSYCKRLRQLSKLGNLDNPEKIKTIICTSQVSEARKELLTDSYDYYVQWRSLSWVKPHFIREDKPIYVPLESELDALISNTRMKLSTFLQLLKETGVDSGEAWKLKWTDLGQRTVNITPTKNHLARTLPISENLLSRLLQLPRVNDRIFANKDLDDFRTNYEQIRNNLSKKLNNPRIRQIAFKSFRHWKATHEYHKTKDILHVKWLLGHKRLENTLVYTHLVNFESDEWLCKVAKNVDECKALIESGFEYVSDCDGFKLFRKRK